MLDTIVSLMKESGVYAWEISDVKTTGWEFYFIRHALDQNRAVRIIGGAFIAGQHSAVSDQQHVFHLRIFRLCSFSLFYSFFLLWQDLNRFVQAENRKSLLTWNIS